MVCLRSTFCWTACISSLILSTLAADIKGRIAWNDICNGAHDLGPARVVLDSGRYGGGVTSSGNWTIPDVPAGTYLLSVVSHDHTFDQLRVDIPALKEAEDGSVTTVAPEIRPYTAGTPLSPPSTISLSYPIVLTPRLSFKKPLPGSSGSAAAYYVPPESFDLLAMFQSPMMLMMVFVGIMMLAMPYLMKNMDPEALEELKDRQAKVASVQSAISSGDLKSGFAALLSGDDDSKPAPAKLQSKSGPGRGRGKRR